MNKKILVFLLGVAICALGWLSFTSSIQEQQINAQAKESRLKIKMFHSTLERLHSVEALSSGNVQKPASFVFEFANEDQDILNESVEASLKDRVSFLDVKKSYLDAGKSVAFFVAELDQAGEFLVRVKSRGESTELVGFPLNGVLNAISYDLEGTAWFLTDAKGRVLASDVKSYVGKRYKATEDIKTHKLVLGGSTLNLSIAKLEPFNLLLANSFGLLGILLMAFSVLFYTQNLEQGEVFAGDLNGENGRPSSNKKDAQNEQSFYAPPVPSALQNVNTGGESLSEEMRMVDLSGENNQKPNGQGEKGLEYSNFLIENPVLGGEKPKTFVEDSVPEKFDSVIEKKNANEWLELAEELTKSIDDFSKNLSEKQSDFEGVSTKTEDPKV